MLPGVELEFGIDSRPARGAKVAGCGPQPAYSVDKPEHVSGHRWSTNGLMFRV